MNQPNIRFIGEGEQPSQAQRKEIVYQLTILQEILREVIEISVWNDAKTTFEFGVQHLGVIIEIIDLFETEGLEVINLNEVIEYANYLNTMDKSRFNTDIVWRDCLRETPGIKFSIPTSKDNFTKRQFKFELQFRNLNPSKTLKNPRLYYDSVSLLKYNLTSETSETQNQDRPQILKSWSEITVDEQLQEAVMSIPELVRELEGE